MKRLPLTAARAGLADSLLQLKRVDGVLGGHIAVRSLIHLVRRLAQRQLAQARSLQHRRAALWRARQLHTVHHQWIVAVCRCEV